LKTFLRIRQQQRRRADPGDFRSRSRCGVTEDGLKTFLRIAALTLFVCCSNREATTDTAVAATTAATTTESATPATPTCTSAPGLLCPVDEAASDPSFAAFREQLRDAVQRRDEAKLLELVDPNIRTSFGDGGGIDAFKKSLPWNELGKILPLGGSFRGEGNDRSFWAPYVYASWPESIDAFEHVAAIRADVPVRASAATDAATVTTVSWAILRIVQDAGNNREWMRVKTADGHEGWVSAADVHSPIGYRAGFMKRDGQWRMNALVAGD
jgi:hypothetical protein